MLRVQGLRFGYGKRARMFDRHYQPDVKPRPCMSIWDVPRHQQVASWQPGAMVDITPLPGEGP